MQENQQLQPLMNTPANQRLIYHRSSIPRYSLVLSVRPLTISRMNIATTNHQFHLLFIPGYQKPLKFKPSAVD